MTKPEDQYGQVMAMLANNYTQADIAKHFNISLANSITLCDHAVCYHSEKIRERNKSKIDDIRRKESELHWLAEQYASMKNKLTPMAIELNERIKSMCFELEKVNY